MTVDAGTIALVLLIVAAVGTACSSLAASLAESSPRASAVFRVVAALLVDVRAALLAGQPNAPVAAKRRAPPVTSALSAILIFVTLAVVGACSSAASIVSGAAAAICSLVVPLTASSPEGTVVAGAICQEVVPVIGPIVAGIVASMAKADRVVVASRLASSIGYVPLRLNGARVGSIDPLIAKCGADAGKWTIGKDGGVDVVTVDGGKVSAARNRRRFDAKKAGLSYATIADDVRRAEIDRLRSLPMRTSADDGEILETMLRRAGYKVS